MISKKSLLCFLLILILAFCISTAFASSGDGSSAEDTPDTAPSLNTQQQKDAQLFAAPLFPQMLFTDVINNVKRIENSKPYWVNSKEEFDNLKKLTDYQVSVLLNYDILAYYGHPGSRNMGILGRHSIEELDIMLTALAEEYEKVSDGRKIQKAFYLIYGTVWPKGNIGIIDHGVLMEYIEYGIKNNILIFIDHQIGRYDPMDSLKRMLPFLKYPNVHLALDPEWRTTKPMVEIGHLTGEEVNTAQQIIEDYLIEHNYPGERMFVIHQFNHAMIKNRSEIRSDFNRVRVVHCADGFGNPGLKRNTYAYNAHASNMPIKAFKLFYDFGIPGAGVDNPIMMPREVYGLKPRPYIIMYQ